MKILVITPLFPPHHAGTFDFRCQWLCQALKIRGNEVLVLTSDHGVKYRQQDAQTVRCLKLNGVHGTPFISEYAPLKALEIANNDFLKETIELFSPEVILVYSLEGLSKSLIFTLYNLKIRTIYHVADGWMENGLTADPWLAWWNATPRSFLGQSSRKALELSGERSRLDAKAPTRLSAGYELDPEMFSGAGSKPVTTIRLDHVIFASQHLKQRALARGFQTEQGEVIYPAVATADFYGERRNGSISRFLMVGPISESSGVPTVIEAFRQLFSQGLKISLSIVGRGEAHELAEIRSQAVRSQAPIQFIHLNHGPRDLAKLYREHDCFIYAAHSGDLFPMGILEAMACQLAVVATPIGAAREFVQHGETGLLFTPGKPEELMEVIRFLHSSRTKSAEMAEIAQARILSELNDVAVLDRIENFINTPVG